MIKQLNNVSGTMQKSMKGSTIDPLAQNSDLMTYVRKSCIILQLLHTHDSYYICEYIERDKYDKAN